MRVRVAGFAFVFVIPAVAAPAAAPPGQAASGVVLAVTGGVPTPLKLTAEAFARLPRQTVLARDHGGKEQGFEGVALAEILKAAGVKLGRDLRGRALATYLVVEAADGYRAVFALPELDPAFTDRVVLLADRCDGRPIAATDGPLRVVVPGEKRHARWVRQVVGLKLGHD